MIGFVLATNWTQFTHWNAGYVEGFKDRRQRSRNSMKRNTPFETKSLH